MLRREFERGVVEARIGAKRALERADSERPGGWGAILKNLKTYLKMHLIMLPLWRRGVRVGATPARVVLPRRLLSVVGGRPAAPSSFPKGSPWPRLKLDAFTPSAPFVAQGLAPRRV